MGHGTTWMKRPRHAKTAIRGNGQRPRTGVNVNPREKTSWFYFGVPTVLLLPADQRASRQKRPAKNARKGWKQALPTPYANGGGWSNRRQETRSKSTNNRTGGGWQTSGWGRRGDSSAPLPIVNLTARSERCNHPFGTKHPPCNHT